MVVSSMDKDRVVSAVKEWFDSLPSGAADWSEDTTKHEHVIRIQPNNPRGSSIELRIGTRDFGVYLDRHFAIESLPLDELQVLDICESVRRGRLKQDIWEFRGKLVGSRSVLDLSSGHLWDRYGGPGPILSRLASERTIQYEPWDH